MQACQFCSSLYLFGRRILEQTGVFCVTTGSRKGLPLPSLAAENCQLELLSVQDATERQKLGQVKRLYTKNSLQTGRLLGTHLWVGDYAARDDDGAVKDFSELVKSGGGIQRLGVMRADIDSLGAAFVAGFAGDGKNPYQFATLSRTAALSRQLSLFFKRYINHICQEILRGDGPDPFARRRHALGHGGRRQILGDAADVRQLLSSDAQGRCQQRQRHGHGAGTHHVCSHVCAPFACYTTAA